MKIIVELDDRGFKKLASFMNQALSGKRGDDLIFALSQFVAAKQAKTSKRAKVKRPSAAKTN